MNTKWNAVERVMLGATRHTDIVLAVLVVAIICLMILPLPPWIVDALIATNLGIAISLIMLAYTNRFLAYTAVIRNLHDQYLEKMDQNLIEQIKNLKLRLNLTRYMQIFGITSLLLCVLTMFLIYIAGQSGSI